MLERTDAITNEVIEPITFVVAYPTVFSLKILSVECSTDWYKAFRPRNQSFKV